jgi:serine protease Do
MKPFGRSLTVMLLCGAAAVAGFFGFNAVQDSRFARAEQQVEATRQQLANVEDLSSVFRQVGRAVEPSVVNINVLRQIERPRQQLPFDEETLRRFFPEGVPEGFRFHGPEGQMPMPPQFGTGSGVIMEAENGEAYILTNHHVAGGATEMVITLHDGRRIENAKLVGGDPRTDLAVIRIEADRLIAAQWGNSDELQKGDWVLAFGSPFGFVGSMTHGIVSALGRQVGIIDGGQGYEEFIQTDAAINPGNSGGPLVNIRGEVVGVNTAIASRTGGFMGIGFAIPSNQARYVYQALKEEGRVVRGWLGVSIADVDTPQIRERARAMGFEEDRGVWVDRTYTGTPAEGVLQPGDIITHMGEQRVGNVRELRNTVAATRPGTEVPFNLFRDGEQQTVTIRIGEQPVDIAAATEGRGLAPPSQQPEAAAVERLGVEVTNVTPELARRHGLRDAGGAVIVSVDPPSLAAQAGLRVGDLITRVNDRRITTADEAIAAIGEADLAAGVRLWVTSRQGSRLVFIRDAQ